MTRHLDPDRSPPPRFWPFPIDIDTSVCDRCSAMVPATDKAQTQHTDHHRQVDALAAGFASAALANQLSGSGSRTATPAGATADASLDPDAEGYENLVRSGRPYDHRHDKAPAGHVAHHVGGDVPHSHGPDPAPKSPPTPPEEATAGPGGAEGSNDGTEADAAAGTSLGDVTPPAAVFPPAAAGTKRVGRGSGDPGDSIVNAPADTLFEPGRQTPADYRDFAR